MQKEPLNRLYPSLPLPPPPHPFAGINPSAAPSPSPPPFHGSFHTTATPSSSSSSSSPFASIRKIQVVYFLCRSSGQLDQPHLLEISIPSNQGLFLKDVKNRLSAIRGTKLPSSFAWSYKRSYKNEYVWQDVCDDDLIFPAHGCDYVLKGSEILAGTSHSSLGITVDGMKSYNLQQQQQRASACGDQFLVAGKGDLINPLQQSVGFRSNPNAEISNCNGLIIPAHHAVSMTETGTDAATQTEADNQHLPQQDEDGDGDDDDDEEEEAAMEARLNLQIQQRSNTSAATEVDIKAEMPSPPSSSSTMSSSPYNLRIKNAAGEAAESKMMAMVRRDSKAAMADRDTVIGGIPDDEDAGKDDGEEGYRSVSNLMKQHTSVEKSESAAINRSNGKSAMANNSNQTVKAKGSNNQVQLLHELLHQSPTSTPSQRLRRSSDNSGNDSSSLKQQCIQSATMSLLQFMSCGRSEIRDQILPMSLYRLRSCKSSASVSDDVDSVADSVAIAGNLSDLQQQIDLDDWKSSEPQNQRPNNWLKIGAAKSSSSAKIGVAAHPRHKPNEDPSNSISIASFDSNHQTFNLHHQNRHRHIQSDPAMLPSAPQSERNNPNLNSSRSTDNHAQVNKNQSIGSTGLHTRRLSSEAMNYMWKSSPLKLGSSCKELAIAAAANHSSNLLMQRSSGELFHCNYICSGTKSGCSPLFVPGKQYINAGVQLELLSKPCYSNNQVANQPVNPRINHDYQASNPLSSSSASANSVSLRKTGDLAACYNDAERI